MEQTDEPIQISKHDIALISMWATYGMMYAMKRQGLLQGMSIPAMPSDGNDLVEAINRIKL